MTKHEVFEESSAEECWRETGKAPTSTRWVDVKKTLDDGVESVRSRLVGRDFKMKGGGQPEQFFAPRSYCSRCRWSIPRKGSLKPS